MLYLLTCTKRLAYIFSLLSDLAYHNHKCDVHKEALSRGEKGLATWTTRPFSLFMASVVRRFDIFGNSIDLLKPTQKTQFSEGLLIT